MGIGIYTSQFLFKEGTMGKDIVQPKDTTKKPRKDVNIDAPVMGMKVK